MQLQFCLDDYTSQLVAIDIRLRRHFGEFEDGERLDAVSQLVWSFLGSRTKGEVSAKAYYCLLRQFGSWEGVRDAPVIAIREAIGEVTHDEQKAVRLKSVLRQITQSCGDLTLAPLDEISVDEAMDWLRRLPGIGPKIAAATLNFSTLHKPVMVIDTHHLRILKRIGLAGKNASIERTYDLVMPSLPGHWGADEMEVHHVLLKRLGQTVCHHKGGDCHRCPLADLCSIAHLKATPVGIYSQPSLGIL